MQTSNSVHLSHHHFLNIRKKLGNRYSRPHRHNAQLTFSDPRTALNISCNISNLVTPVELKEHKKENFSFIEKNSFDTENFKLPSVSRNNVKLCKSNVGHTVSPNLK